MKNLNRRQWLRSAGLAAGAAAFLGPSAAARVPDFSEYLRKAEGPEPPPGVVKLSSNENPYGPSEKVRQAMVAAFDDACRYPFQEQVDLTNKIAAKYGLSPEHILVTIGSTEGLKISALTYAIEGEIVTADPTFEAMLYYAEHFGAHIVRVPVKEDMSTDLNGLDRRISNNTNLVFLCNPNNPTGTIVDARQLQQFCEATSKRTMLFSDEAYYDYITQPGYPSMVELVKKDYNVIVSKTFSKVYGLAGLRIGYLIARPDIITRLKERQVERTTVPSCHAAATALDEQEFYRFSLLKTNEAKQIIYRTLDDIGLRYVPSHANFVFFETGREIDEFRQQMLDLGIRVGRPFPPFRKWCRVSTGTLEEVQLLRSALLKAFS